MTKAGKAYGFFYCNASKEAIESELPTIKKMVKTDGLKIFEGKDYLQTFRNIQLID